MPKGKKVNPRRKPISEADLRAKLKKGTYDACKMSYVGFCVALRDVYGFGAKRINAVVRRYEEYLNDLIAGRVKLQDAIDALEDEGIIFVWTGEEK